MSLELIMNENGSIDHAAGSLISGGVFTIVSVPSIPTKSEGAGIYRGPFVFTFAGGAASSLALTGVVSTGPQTIQPTAVKAKDAQLPVVRLGDIVVMACTGVNASGVSVPVAGGVEVSDAGQSTARGL